MSDDISYQEVGFDVVDAVGYNAASGPRLGWKNAMPAGAVAEHPALALDPEGSEAERILLAQAIYTVQGTMGFRPYERDGKLGPHTWGKILHRFDNVESWEHYYLHGGRRIVPPTREGRSARVIAFDKAGGLDLHRAGHFTQVDEGEKPKRIVVHWGGIDPPHLHRVFSGHRKVSSHFACGNDDGQPIIYQFLDLAHRSWHAGWANHTSIGLDISQQPTRKFLKLYRKRKQDVDPAENEVLRPNGGRVGPRDILTLDPVIATAVRDLVLDLCEILDIPPRAPRANEPSDPPSGTAFSGNPTTSTGSLAW